MTPPPLSGGPSRTADETALTCGSKAVGLIWRSIKLALTQRTIGSVSGSQASATSKFDAVLVGTGIMSATLSALLRRLEPSWSITMVERLDGAAAERFDRHRQSGAGQRGISGHASVLGLRGRERHGVGRPRLSQPGAAC